MKIDYNINGVGICISKASDYDRIFVVGDIHAHYTALLSIWNVINFTNRDLLVFLGDYIMQGKEPIKCVEFIMTLLERNNVIALIGNNDTYMETKYNEFSTISKNKLQWWLKCNQDHPGEMDATEVAIIKAIIDGEDIKPLIAAIKKFPALLYLDDVNIYMSHSGYDVKVGLENCNLVDFTSNREEFWKYYYGDAIWYVGHTSVNKLHYQYGIGSQTRINKPFLDNNIWYMDTSEYYKNKGYLSCIEIKSGKLYQADFITGELV